MLVVADTTPIISLLKIDKLDLLQKLFGNVKIPKAVYDELTRNSDFNSESRIIKHCEFLELEEVSNIEAVEILQKKTGLDNGESEAIVLAGELDANLILLDEEAGRTVAANIGLTIMGTVGILITAKRQNLISADEIKNVAEVFRSTGRYMSEHLYKQLLNFAN